MGKLTEMEAKLRKGPSMLGHAKFHERLQGHVIELATSVDALTAERDELQRRLDAVVVKISEAVVSDDDCVCSMLCHSAITAIAEGRDNG